MTNDRSKPAAEQSRSPDRSVIHALVPRAQNSSALALGCIAVFIALLYWLVFARPFSLIELSDRPLLDLWKLSRNDPQARWRLLGGLLIQGGLYWLGWRVARNARGRAPWVVVLGGALISATVLIFLYPFDAADVFDNIMQGRILGVYGANPFQEIAWNFKLDPFFRYVAWRYTSSAYGPAWEILAAGTARLVGDEIVANVVAFKLIGGIFLAGSVAVVAAILREAAPERALPGVVLLAWNPVILYETLGHGHNDVVMVFWILTAIWCLQHARYALAILSLVLGALVKFIPLLMLPAALLIAMRNLPNARARLRFISVASVSAVVLVIVAYAPFWHGLDTLNIEVREGMFTTSLPSVLHISLEPTLGEERAAEIISRIAGGLTFLFAVGQGVGAARHGTWLGFARASFNILMFYLLLTCLWFQSWYAVWPLGVAALLPPGHAARLGVLFGYAALGKPLVFGPMWLWTRPLPPRFWRELRLGPAVLALPWLYASYAIWRGRHRSEAEERV